MTPLDGPDLELSNADAGIEVLGAASTLFGAVVAVVG